jgi:oligosaccharide repeat unit polymerase
MRLNIKIFANPYYLFAAVWTICVIFYSFGWARIYPVLSAGLLFFVAITVLVNVFFGMAFQKFIANYSINTDKKFRIKNLVIINSVIWFAHFVYNRGIPIFKIFGGDDFDHLSETFGIPVVVVFSTAFTGFLCLLTFHHFLKFKKKEYLLYFIINFSFFVMIFSRGILMMSLLSLFSLWIMMQKGALTVRNIAVIVVSVLLLLYGFGLAGNSRTAAEVKDISASDNISKNGIILEIADPSPAFKNSIVPDEYMWSYLYFTSPLGNLQENIDRTKIDISFSSTLAYLVNEFTFDFVSKRIQDAFGIKKYEKDLIVPALSVPTVFGEAYVYLGYVGIVFYAIAMLVLPFFYFLVIRKFPLWQLGMSVLCAIYFFSIFDNMFIFSGLSLQLFFPLFFLGKEKEALQLDGAKAIANSLV